jgi:hypothetical protein
MHQLSERFVQALADKDSTGLKALLRHDIDFRAMTPSRFWESNDVDEVVDDTIFGTWFDPSREITDVVAVETDRIGSLERVAYRFTVKSPRRQVHHRAAGLLRDRRRHDRLAAAHVHGVSPARVAAIAAGERSAGRRATQATAVPAMCVLKGRNGEWIR